MNKPDAPDVRKAAETALDLFVYAPVGLAFEARSLLPKLAQRGRNQVVLARFGARFARQRAEAEAERLIQKLHTVIEDEPRRPDDPIDDVSDGFDKDLAETGATTPPEPASSEPAVLTPTVRKRTARKSAPSKTPTRQLAGPAKPVPKTPPRKASTSSSSRAQVERPKRADALPISGYDTLSASQVVPRLTAMTPEEREAIGAYEASHRGRRTILNRVAQLRS